MRILLFVAFFFIGCSSYSKSFEKKVELQEKINIRTKKMGLTLAGFGGSSTEDNIIKRIDSMYAIYEKSDVVKARRLIVQLALGAIEEVNKDLSMAEYLDNFPIDVNLCSIRIVFAEYGLHAYTSADNSLSGVTLAHGRLTYDQEDAVSEQYMYIHKETFEEGLAIVRSEQNNEAY